MTAVIAKSIPLSWRRPSTTSCSYNITYKDKINLTRYYCFFIEDDRWPWCAIKLAVFVVGRSRLGFCCDGLGSTIFVDIHYCFDGRHVCYFMRSPGPVRRYEAHRYGIIICCSTAVLARLRFLIASCEIVTVRFR